jgi:hypothetical protein
MFPDKIIENPKKNEKQEKRKKILEAHTEAIFCFATLAYYFLLFCIFAEV